MYILNFLTNIVICTLLNQYEENVNVYDSTNTNETKLTKFELKKTTQNDFNLVKCESFPDKLIRQVIVRQKSENQHSDINPLISSNENTTRFEPQKEINPNHHKNDLQIQQKISGKSSIIYCESMYKDNYQLEKEIKHKKIENHFTEEQITKRRDSKLNSSLTIDNNKNKKNSNAKLEFDLHILPYTKQKSIKIRNIKYYFTTNLSEIRLIRSIPLRGIIGFFNTGLLKIFIGSSYAHFESISSGSFGLVYKAVHKKSKESVAIKAMLHLDNRKIKHINEIRALNILKHKNIVSLRKIYVYKNVVLLVMEHIESTLLNYLRDFKSIKNLLLQLIDALEYIHSAGIIHRDIKPDNVLVSKDMVLKLADFGMCSINEKYPDNCQGGLSTLGYKAPELFEETGYHDKTVDIYAFGIIVFEMITSRFLIYELNFSKHFTIQNLLLKNPIEFQKYVRSFIQNNEIVNIIINCCGYFANQRMHLCDAKSKILKIDPSDFY